MPSGCIAYATYSADRRRRNIRTHGIGLLHCDLKPPSVLAKKLIDGFYAVKVVDLGKCVEANPCARLPVDMEGVEESGIACQTLFYRIPEIFFRDAAFGRAVDARSLGA